MSQSVMDIDPNRSYGRKAIADLLGVTPRCVNQRVARRQLPKPVKIGRDPFWSGKILREWMEAKTTNHPNRPI